jgi:hypothetical protein
MLKIQSLQEMRVCAANVLLDRADGNAQTSSDFGVRQIFQMIESPHRTCPLWKLMQSRNQLLDRLGAKQRALWTERLPSAPVHRFIVGLMSFRGAGGQPAPAIVQYIGCCSE